MRKLRRDEGGRERRMAEFVKVEVGPVTEMPHAGGMLPGVVLKDEDGTRSCVFTMTREQGAFLAAVQSGQAFSRPMTHDFICGLLEATGTELERVSIVRSDGKAFFAEANVRSATGAKATVDCRPSDGLLLALRLGVQVYASADVLKAP
jgi:bifunctional DNase/RNase